MNYYYTEQAGEQWRKWPDYCPIPTFEDLGSRMVHGMGRDAHVTVNCPVRKTVVKVHAFCRPSGFVWDASRAQYDKWNETTTNNLKINPKDFQELL